MQNILVEKYNVNTDALDAVLRAAFGEQVFGISTGPHGVIVHLADDVTPAQIAQAEQIVIDHDPSILTPEQIAAAHAEQVEADSYTDIVAIPGWAHWDEETVLAWIDDHTSATQVNAIANLEQAKIVLNDMATQLRALSRLCVALRNKVYPNLET
jgi:hypothetical protein